MTSWHGLRKHVIQVILVEEKNNDHFIVTFDDLGHSGGTYSYPATDKDKAEYKDGSLDYERFYGW